MANVIYTQVLKSYESISWQGSDIYKRFTQLSNHLKQGMGVEYASFFASPHISRPALQGKGKARWTSEIFTEKAKPITTLSEQEKKRYIDLFDYKKSRIIKYCNKLQSSNKQDDKNWAELINIALQIPDESHILTENDDVVIVAWGFRYIEGKEQNYDLIKKTKFPQGEEPIINKPIVNKNPIVDKPINNEDIIEENPIINKPIIEKPIINNDPIEKNPIINEDIIEEKPIIDEPIRNKNINYLPEKPNVIIPIDPSKIIDSPDNITSIVADRLNIALTGNKKDIKQFAKEFKQIYPDSDYRIIYYSPITFRLQIEVPAEKRAEIKKELAQKMPNFKMLIWHESLFQSNSSLDKNDFDKKKTWHFDKTKAFDAWDISKGNENVIVAVIDNGFDLDCKFAGEIYMPCNIITGDSNVNVGNGYDHGTHVAGIATGLKDYKHEVLGVAPNCKFMPIQIADNNGLMSNTATIDGVLYAISNGANVVNMSLGMIINSKIANLPQKEQESYINNYFKDEEAFWEQLFEMASQENITFVLAAGNDNIMIGINPMQRSEKTIIVTATNQNNEKAGFSNYGKKATISAPGTNIYSSLPNNNAGYKDGTSMAAPIVAGGIALIKSVNPELNHNEIVKLIQATGIPVKSSNNYTGNVIQLGAAVAGANNIPPTIIDSGNKPSWFKRNWKWILLILIAILFIILCFIFCRSERKYLPDNPNVIVPIDTTKIISDPDSVRSIISDRINIALQGENRNIDEFAKQFKDIYSEESYKIIYYDTLTYRIQIQVPSEKRAIVKKELPEKMSNFKMLIWSESLFKKNYIPSDPDFGNNKKSWYHKKVKVFDAWDISKGDTNIVVAIIDNGFDLTHPEFAGKIIKPWNITTRSANVNTGLKSEHGTHVAGIAIGLADNGQGVSGIAPNCKFMPIQVGDYNGNMSNTAVIDGVLYAINNGADVVNMSLGMSVDPRIQSLPQSEQEAYIKFLFKEEEVFWEQLFDMAYEKNIVFVLAAGNENVLIGLDPMQRSEKTIKVSAIDHTENKADFSNYGSKSTISAPGIEIYSSMPNNTFAYKPGTSMAAPVVAGGIAIIKSINPALSFDEIVDLIQYTGIPVNSPNAYVGNIIQLDVAAQIANNNRKKQPIIDCPDMQNKIDSLLQEIEKIRKQCPDTSINTGDTLKIPDKPKDYKFAEGRWKSTTNIISVSTGEKVTIYFDFYTNGKGKVTLVEADNTQCTADLDLSLNTNKFIIDQKRPSICNPPPETYNQYTFECEPDNTGCAECWAQNKIQKSNKFKFKLIKIK